MDRGTDLAAAMRRAGVVWVQAAGSDQPRPAWHVWQGGAMYVVCGGAEQPLPELMSASSAQVLVRDPDGTVGLSWAAEVHAVEVGGAEWEAVVPKLHAKRLNAPDGDLQPARWALESRVLRLAPKAS